MSENCPMCPMMEGPMGSMMMGGMWIGGVLLLIVLVLAAAALVKYLFFSGPRKQP